MTWWSWMVLGALLLGVELGYASGDKSPGFGVRPFDEKQFEHNLGDNSINNFRFHPDDELLRFLKSL